MEVVATFGPGVSTGFGDSEQKLVTGAVTLPITVMFSWDGGEGEIRTHGTRKGSAVFKTAALNHSATSP